MQRKDLRFKLSSIGLSIVALLSLTAPVNAGSTDNNGNIKLRMPKRNFNRAPKTKRPCAWRSNTLLVMPYKAADDASHDSLSELEGTVTRTIGHGAMTVWEVTFPDTSHFVKAEKELTSDKNFRSVQRDYYMHATATTNDPYFAQQWYLNALNVPAAWDRTFGSAAASIAVIDTGVTTTNTDLQGKLFGGYNAITNQVGFQSDVNGHGTMVSTTAAATANNLISTVGPARLSTIIPIRAGQPSGSFTSADILDGFNFAINNTSTKLINFSVNADPPYSIANGFINSTLHTYLRYFHDVRGGLTFNAAGNGDDNGDGIFDNNSLKPYLIVVSALGESNVLTDFSNYGNCIWFTAPGENIVCTKDNNTIVSVAGTSFSSPLACSIAALIWGAKPSLTNLQVEQIMKTHCLNSSPGWNQYYGYGIPDAAACVIAAQSTVTTPSVPVPPPVTKKKNVNKLWKKKN